MEDLPITLPIILLSPAFALPLIEVARRTYMCVHAEQ